MSIETVTRSDPRYRTLVKGKNSRFPASEADTASRIELCDNAADVATALQRAVSEGLRPTVRSGGHCYEDFVYNNPGGVVLDLSLFTETTSLPDSPRYRIAAGAQLGGVYSDLYKRYGVTLPGGTCGSVAAGGHISGGGYGLLSRLQGLTCDWLSAVDVLTVDAKGKVVERRVDRKHDPDLLRACRGAGGGNFGIITNYFFDELPPAPQEVITASIIFSWLDMTEERFESILKTYGNYWETRGKDRETWGLFTLFGVTHRTAGHFGISIQFCNPDGTCKDLKVLDEFIGLFQACKPVPSTPGTVEVVGGERALHHGQPDACWGQQMMSRHLWLDANVRGWTGGGAGGEQRGKYKSSYMRRNFTSAEIACFYKHLTRTIPGVDLSRSTVSVDSYGGATNRKELIEETSMPQRDSVMKLQFMTFWNQEQEDAAHAEWIQEFFAELYSGPDAHAQYRGTPYWNDHYEGCYINYPDKDMLRHSFWPQLFYGDKGLVPALQSVKRRYDPNNIFHHAMSIRA
ncbi:FAD-binding protein [Granulicella sp. dw_53]|uniref:FAD-dependent oxidoreductase n=1 Tax=Granulicella sp. dw_53 TaxID=2719792 RepID=UPI001BD56688|nr:FAD-binding protein [Granulicella sp. dw_53]